MPWRDADDDLDESEFPDEADLDDVVSTSVPCPYCFHTVYDDAERCPGCGTYLSREDAPNRRPWWFLLGVGACLLVVFRWIFG